MKFSKVEVAALGVTAVTLALFAVWFLYTAPGAEGYRVRGGLWERTPPSATTRVYIPDVLVDLNKAELEDLMGLPGIGETRAQAILDYRTQHGPFQAPEELMNVSGIGQATYQGLSAYITV